MVLDRTSGDFPDCRVRRSSVTLKFRSALWLYHGPGAWHFITLPLKHAKAVKTLSQGTRRGWGALRVIASIGRTTWKTSIFPDQKSNSYVLPVKAEVRNKENLENGDIVMLTLEIAI
ncbi:MAG: DUF1905 domain-containing protein [Bacteroidetes bacterium]|nr:DUF1905 domain-containing protein [Bacteroidota bacterium]MCW5896797.1 DUF1905 domain-containing protein [Bacteroidota bacterium]